MTPSVAMDMIENRTFDEIGLGETASLVRRSQVSCWAHACRSSSPVALTVPRRTQPPVRSRCSWRTANREQNHEGDVSNRAWRMFLTVPKSWWPERKVDRHFHELPLTLRLSLDGDRIALVVGVSPR